MIDAYVYDGEILVIDKSLEPRNEDMAVCFIDGEFTLKYIKIKKKIILLDAYNETHKLVKVTIKNDSLIWGIVTYCIQNKRRR